LVFGLDDELSNVKRLEEVDILCGEFECFADEFDFFEAGDPAEYDFVEAVDDCGVYVSVDLRRADDAESSSHISHSCHCIL